MVKVTLLELHLEESDFTANAPAPFGPGEKDVDAGGEPPEPDESSRKGAALAAVVGLVFLVLVAYVAKRRFLADGESADDAFDIDE